MYKTRTHPPQVLKLEIPRLQTPKHALGIIHLPHPLQARMALLPIARKDSLIARRIVHIDKAMEQTHVPGERDAASHEALGGSVHGGVVGGVGPGEVQVHEGQGAGVGGEAEGVAAAVGHLGEGVCGDGLEGEGGEEAGDGEDGGDFFDEEGDDFFEQGRRVVEGGGAEGFAQVGGLVELDGEG
jgi:hypothetical protein